ncbi:MAG: hypothetical protein A3B38_04415 [Candidatus Levybacteria bacterium RIFCSPLOWO2_01_FULL_36_13]|nr:MAG: hypothetical protein A2684_00160 [Candidatus Levybacteria bacterium RIFCSPHIGHO2_01_FULL_36_15b]OGH34072.1 MAG: hypothetical protein A3B38_04415 [Candidatus Levybacteria bacterium RIFCSPLOWO2_01_FULL_36_13]
MKFVMTKSTPARIAIADFLSSSAYPVDIGSIIRFLRSKNLKTNKVTVYRTIDFLLQEDLVKRVEFGEGKYRYELQKDHHHHLICTNCKKIEDVEGEYLRDLESKIRNKKGFLVKNHSLEFFGICKQCQQ